MAFKLKISMDIRDSYWEYYSTGKYKGFYKIKEYRYPLSSVTNVILSNGKLTLSATGRYTEEALQQIFEKIDKLPNPQQEMVKQF